MVLNEPPEWVRWEQPVLGEPNSFAGRSNVLGPLGWAQCDRLRLRLGSRPRVLLLWSRLLVLLPLPLRLFVLRPRCPLVLLLPRLFPCLFLPFTVEYSFV